MPSIMPTPTCFDDALDTLAEMAKASPGGTEDLFLVHGLVRPTGTLWAYAWVEWDSPEGPYVIFMGLVGGERQYFIADRDEFYADTHAEEVTRYTVRAAHEEHARTNHYGPWRPRYRAYCLSPQERGCGALRGLGGEDDA